MDKVFNDQAQSLREKVDRARRQTNIITIASGSHGTGKSHVTANLALALCKLRKKVLVVSGGIAHGGMDIMLGVDVTCGLGHYLQGEKSLKDIILPGHEGIGYISGGAELYDLFAMDNTRGKTVTDDISKLGGDVDYLIFDTSDCDENTVRLACASREVIVVTTQDPSAVLDAYALIKTISIKAWPAPPNIRIIMNKTRNKKDAEQALNGFQGTIRKHLNSEADALGCLPFSADVPCYIKGQPPLMLSGPGHDFSRSVMEMALILTGTPQQETANPIADFLGRMTGGL